MMTAITVGAVAQLGERDIRIVEVRGSTPLGSTTTVFTLLFPRFLCEEGLAKADCGNGHPKICIH